ncbi:MAG: hypothetical protein QOH59_722 [Gemmatimonadales bacterium]|jgi:hypothetical protein|nr:hypothetical protein [Gemmatimonadales bacterium]
MKPTLNRNEPFLAERSEAVSQAGQTFLSCGGMFREVINRERNLHVITAREA